MADLVLPIQTSTLPVGFCPTDYQSMWNGFAAAGFVTFPSTFSGITVSATKPTDTTQAWLQLDTLGRPVRLYFFAQGAWLSQHPMVPGLTVIWTTALPNLNTFDGGDANPVSPIAGPMWEVVATFAARSPIGVGTLPDTTVINVGDTLGSQTSTLPTHTHVTGRFDGVAGSTADDLFALTGTDTLGGSAQGCHGDNGLEVKDLTAAGGPYTVTGPPQGTPNPINVVHPVLGVYFIRRTNRLFYVVP